MHIFNLADRTNNNSSKRKGKSETYKEKGIFVSLLASAFLLENEL